MRTLQFAGSFTDRIAGFARERPAWLNLHAASIHYRRDPAARRAVRSTIANMFRTKNPSLSSERATRWVVPKWGKYELGDIKTVAVEQWLKTLTTPKFREGKHEKPLRVGRGRRSVTR